MEENNLTQNSNNQSKLVTIIGVIIGIIIGIPVFIYILNLNIGTNKIKEFSSSETKWTCSLSGNYYEGHCICIVKNNTDKNYSYVSITFTIYDEEGSVITTAIDNTSSLSAKGTWKVDAYYISYAGKGKPKKCSITNITGY